MEEAGGEGGQVVVGEVEVAEAAEGEEGVGVQRADAAVVHLESFEVDEGRERFFLGKGSEL